MFLICIVIQSSLLAQTINETVTLMSSKEGCGSLTVVYQYSLSGAFNVKYEGEAKQVTDRGADDLLRTYRGEIRMNEGISASIKVLSINGDKIHNENILTKIDTRLNGKEGPPVDYEKVPLGELPSATINYTITPDVKCAYNKNDTTLRIEMLSYSSDGPTGAVMGLEKAPYLQVLIHLKLVKGEGAANKEELKDTVAHVVEDIKASDQPGEAGNPVPIGPILAIVGSLAVGAAGYTLTRKKKKTDGGDTSKVPDHAELRVFKGFGDTLTPGEERQQLFARIVRVRKDGTEYTDPTLTQMLRIAPGDDYLRVDGAPMHGEWQTAWVSAPYPAPSPCPKDGVVSLSFGNDKGSYTCRLHFDIKEAEMHFAQENLTLPARYDKPVRLPFVIDGMESDAKVSVTLTDKAGRPSGYYDIHVEWNKEKEEQEAVIVDKVLDEKEDSHTAGHFIELNIHLEANNGKGLIVKCDYLLVRFYMGMVYDIGAGYDGYEVGCYLEEYNIEKHGKKVIWGESGGKTYVPAVTKGHLRIYDYDEKNHSILIVSPAPDPKLFKVRALDESEQGRVDKLGVNFLPCDTGHPRGTQCTLLCMKGLLDAPSRIDAMLEWGARYKGKEYRCERQVLLCSQPRRPFRDAATWDAQIKADRETLDYMDRVEAFITRHGLMERLKPLVTFMNLMRDGYLEDYGIDREQAQLVHRVFLYMTTTLSDYTFDEGYKPLTLAGEVAQWFADAGRAVLDSANELNKYVAPLMLIARLVSGVHTIGLSEGFFIAYDTISAALLAVNAAELYVNEGGDAVTQQMRVMAKEAAKFQIFMMGLQLCARIAVTPPGGAAPLSVRASSSNPKKRPLPEPSKKRFSTGKKSAASKKATDESNHRQQIARDEVRSPGNRNKTKGKSSDKGLRRGVEHGKTKAVSDVNELEAIVRRCESDPSPENLQKLREAVLNVQGNKQAMYRLNALGEEYNEVRSVFNNEMLKIYEETDQAVIYELAAKHHLSLDRIGKGNVSSNKLDDLRKGKLVTYDRDTHYYYIDDNGNKIFFPQRATQEMYNRHFHEAATGFKAGNQKVADFFTKAMDGTVIEDAAHHPESFGKKNLEILMDENQHYKPLDNAKQVSDTIIYKTEEWLAEGDRLLAKAQETADPKLRADLEAKAVSAYMEGNRQTLKDFKRFVKPYDEARTDINGRSFVTDNMRKAVEEIEMMFDAKDAISVDELNVKLSLRGYTPKSLVHDIADAMYKAGGGQ